MNDYLLYTGKAVIWLTSQVYLVQLNTHPHARTPPAAFCRVECTWSFYMGDILTVVTSVCLHWRGRVNLSDGILNYVLLQLRMRNGGSGGVFMFALAPAFSTYPVLGILKQTCPVPSSVRCPIVFHFPHWWKWKRNRHKHPIVNYEICTGNWEVFTKQTWLCHGKETLSREGVTGAFPASEVCPALSLRCWGDRALGFFHYTRVMLLVWFTQYVLAAFAGFCGSKSAAQAEAQTLPGLHSKYNMHGEETSINNLFSPVKDDIVLRSLVLFHFVNLVVPTGCCTMSYSKHRHRKEARIVWCTHPWGLCPGGSQEEDAGGLCEHPTSWHGWAGRASLMASHRGFLSHMAS